MACLFIKLLIFFSFHSVCKIYTASNQLLKNQKVFVVHVFSSEHPKNILRFYFMYWIIHDTLENREKPALSPFIADKIKAQNIENLLRVTQ